MMSRRTFVLSLARFAASVTLAASGTAQVQFAESTKSHLPFVRVDGHGIAAGDIDGDGDLDLFVASLAWSGERSRLFRNDGGHAFTDITATHWPSIAFFQTHPVFGDVDGDADLDLVVADAFQDRLYLNDGAGHFLDATFGRMPTDLDDTRRFVLADLDGDGDLDLAGAHYGAETIYLNDGTGVFADVSATHVPGAWQESTWDVAAGDIDGDGDLDLALASQSTHRLWRNDGSGVFADVSAARLPPFAAQGTAVAFGDVDGDADLDLVFGNWQSAPTLYFNDGTGAFTHASAGQLPAVPTPCWDVDLVDVDTDGDLDVVFGGLGQDRLCTNDGNGTFTDATAACLPATGDATTDLAFADLDGDGDLDLAAANAGQSTRLCFNEAGVFADATATRLDTEASGAYALALGDVDADGDLDLVVGNGDAGGYAEKSLLQLNDGNGVLRGAPAAAFPVHYDDVRAVALGDVDGDLDLDVVLGHSNVPPRLCLNDGTGAFADTSGKLSAPADDTRALGIGDVDGDGDRDLVLGNVGQSRLFLNDGQGDFTDATAGRLPAAAVETRALALIDVDGDGDRDLVLANGLAAGQQNRLYQNDGTGTFTDVTGTHFPSDTDPSSSVAAGDIDGDGDLDLVFGNDAGTLFGSHDSLYVNDGSGRFTSAPEQIISVYSPYRTLAVAFGDVDEDGDLDLVEGDYNHWNKLHLNDGAGTFTDASWYRMPLSFEDTTAIALGDLDGDGDLDLISAGFGWLRYENALYANHHRQIWSRRLMHVGETYELEVSSRAGYATGAQAALVILGTATAAIPLPPHGTLRIDPAGMAFLPLLTIEPPTGMATVAVPIPNAPALIGLHLYWQALVVPLPDLSMVRFTNRLDERIWGY